MNKPETLKLNLPQAALPALGELLELGRGAFALGELECPALVCEVLVWRVLKAAIGPSRKFAPLRLHYLEAVAMHRMLQVVGNTAAARPLLLQLDPWLVRQRGLRETQWHERHQHGAAIPGLQHLLPNNNNPHNPTQP